MAGMDSAVWNELGMRPLVGGVEQGESASAPVWKDGYLSIPTAPPPAGDGYTYSSGDGSVGDVDGDGRYEIILKWDPSNPGSTITLGTAAVPVSRKFSKWFTMPNTATPGPGAILAECSTANRSAAATVV